MIAGILALILTILLGFTFFAPTIPQKVKNLFGWIVFAGLIVLTLHGFGVLKF